MSHTKAMTQLKMFSEVRAMKLDRLYQIEERREK
jgi:hypothetical protein